MLLETKIGVTRVKNETKFSLNTKIETKTNEKKRTEIGPDIKKKALKLNFHSMFHYFQKISMTLIKKTNRRTDRQHQSFFHIYEAIHF